MKNLSYLMLVCLGAGSFVNAQAQSTPHSLQDVCGKIRKVEPFPVDDPFQAISPLRDTWDAKNFTDPAQHDPNHFQYIINKIDYGSKKWVMSELDDPDVVQGNSRICTSMIRQDDLMNYGGRIGLIIQVPKENYGPMCADDIASGAINDYNTAAGSFKYSLKRYPLISPEEMIRDSLQNQRYNEIDIMGTNCSTGTQVKVVGIIAECKNWKSILNGQTTHLWNKATEPTLLDDCMGDYKIQDYVTQIHKLSETLPILLMKN